MVAVYTVPAWKVESGQFQVISPVYASVPAIELCGTPPAAGAVTDSWQLFMTVSEVLWSFSFWERDTAFIVPVPDAVKRRTAVAVSSAVESSVAAAISDVAAVAVAVPDVPVDVLLPELSEELETSAFSDT